MLNSYAFFIKIAILVIIIAIIISAIIYYKFIRYKSVSYFNQKLFDVFYSLNIHNKSISILVGDYKLKKTILSSAYTAYGYQFITIDNVENDGIIDVIQIAVFGNNVVFNIIEYENFQHNKSVYDNFFDMLKKYLNKPVVVNSVILLLDSQIQGEDFYENNTSLMNLVSHIVYISDITMPLYIICNTNIASAQTLINYLDADFYSQCIGVGVETYRPGTIFMKYFVNQIKTICNQIQSICLNSIISSNKTEDNIMLAMLHRDFEINLNASIEGVCKNINKTAGIKNIVCRHILITGLFSFSGSSKYLFLDNFFNEILSQEKNIAYFKLGSLYTNRSKTLEIIIAVCTTIAFIYLSVSSFFYLDTLKTMQLYVSNINHTSDDKYNAMSVIENLNKVNSTYNNASIFNIIYLGDNLYNNTRQLISNYSTQWANSAYIIARKSISGIIKENLQLNSIDSTKPKSLSSTIKDRYDKFWQLVESHNNINPNQNAIKQIFKLTKTLIGTEATDSGIINDNYVIHKYQKINIKEFNTYTFSRSILSSMMTHIDNNHPVHQILKLNNFITMLFTSNDVMQTIEYINTLKNIIDELNLSDLMNSLSLKECYELLDELHKINYISDLEYSRLKIKVDEQSLKYKSQIQKLENKLIGKVVVLNDEEIVFSDNIKNIYNNCIKIVNSNIYKRLILHIENMPVSVSGNFKILINVDNLSMIISEFNNMEQTMENNYIDNEFKKILIKILDVEIKHTWNESSKSIGNVYHAADKYLHHFQQSMKQYYEQYKFLFQQATKNRFIALNDKLEQMLTEYINVIVDKIKTCNIFKDKVSIKHVCENYFGYLFSADSPSIYNERIENAVKELQDLTATFTDNLYLIRQYSNNLLDSGMNGKTDYIFNLIQEFLFYEKDSANSLMGRLKTFLVEGFNKSNEIAIKVDKSNIKNKNYLSEVYFDLLNNYNSNVYRYRIDTLKKDWSALQELCAEQKSQFPLSIFNSKDTVSIEMLDAILSYSVDIIDKIIEYQDTEDNPIYSKIIDKLYPIQMMSKLVEDNDEIPITINVGLSNNLQSTSQISIKVVDSVSGKESVYALDKNNCEISIMMPMKSTFSIILGPLLQNMVNYNPMSSDNVTISDNVVVSFDSPGYIDFIRRSINGGNEIGSIMYNNIEIPIIITSLSLDKGEYKKSYASGSLNIKVICNLKLISAIKDFNTASQSIIKDKII